MRTGSTCCRASRSCGRICRVIVMSAQNTFMTAVKAAERGAFEYLPKPFDLKELIAVVARALSREPKEPVKPDEGGERLPLVGRSRRCRKSTACSPA
jgi:DNA-binding NtrC family response regulator